jgi:uncharacterized lipoprotein YddW (UPF0748 family)
MKRLNLITYIIIIVSLACCGSTDNPNDTPTNKSGNQYFLWVDATANFSRLSNSQDSIAKYLLKAKEAGITDLVVDVRPISGEVLYNSAIAPKLTEWKGFVRTANFDYLEAFVSAAEEAGLNVYASINTFTGGHLYSPFWEQTNSGTRQALAKDHPDWISQNYVWDGSTARVESMWTYYGGRGSKPAAFLNPVNSEAQAYILSIINEIVSNYHVKGIILDRGRFDSLESDFSALTKTAFENYIGNAVAVWPDDVFKWTGNGVKTEGTLYKKWIEFRASIIYNFFQQAKQKAKGANKEFGTYVGAWYASYYNEGVNWASKTYDPSTKYTWATPDYKNYGYAEELDFILTGCYSSNVSGVDNYIEQSKAAINGKIPIAAGLYVDDYVSVEKNNPGRGKTTFYDCLVAARKGTKNIMIFDMVHLNDDLYSSEATPKYWDVLASVLK